MLGIISLGLLIFSQNISCEEENVDFFKVNNEIKISLQDMDCGNFMGVNFRKTVFNFEYPKLLILEDEDPVIAFIDANSEKLILVRTSEQGIRIENRISSFGKYFWAEWPVIYIKENKIYLAVEIEVDRLSKKKGIKIFLLDKQKNQLNLQISRFFKVKGKHVSLWGLFPYKEKFIILGNFSDSYFHPLALISGHSPTFMKNFSFALDDNEIFERQTIEEEGWFGVKKVEYAVSDLGIIQCAWVRDTSRVGFSRKHDQTICYSENKDGKKWEKPFELYTVKEIESLNQITNLSLANHGKSAFLLWQDDEKGFYFSEIKDGIQYEITKISDLKRPPENPRHIEPLWGASTTKIAVDFNGNVYALWVMNFDRKYQTFLKTRIDGKWTETVVVNSGHGTVKLPDMKVDKKGLIHITYIKQKPSEKFACYYLKVEKVR